MLTTAHGNEIAASSKTDTDCNAVMKPTCLLEYNKYCVQLVLDAPLRMRVARPTVEIARRDSFFSLDSALDAVSWLDTEQLVIEL